MDGKTQTCLRILGVLLLVLIFTLQAQASTFPEKQETDISSAIATAQADLRETIQNYESDFQQRLAQEDAAYDQNMIPNWNLIAANRGK